MVILAGSIVRMSGSGMGCPDWPKCYGYYIPPSDIEPLTYRDGKVFSKGQMVLLNDTLWVAQDSVFASNEFNRVEWTKYPEHDYAYYNPVHTWIEYVNRLIGALSGIPVFILFVLSFIHLIKQKDRTTFVLAALTLFMLGFEAWLGKTVVDAELLPVKITLHMLGSIVIVALIMMIIHRHRILDARVKINSLFWKIISAVWAIIAFSQIVLGTQVREALDIVADRSEDRWTWIDQLPWIFKVHRSFSILVVALLIFTYIRSKGLSFLPRPLKGMFIVAILEIAVGMTLAYAGVPAFAQPIHLFFAIIWFAFAWSFMLISWRKEEII
jgi:cytochrome c oxidase assembly protein subunit 15